MFKSSNLSNFIFAPDSCFPLHLLSVTFSLCRFPSNTTSVFSSSFIKANLIFKFYFKCYFSYNFPTNNISEVWILMALYLLWHFPPFNLFGVFPFIIHFLLKRFFKSRNHSLIMFIPIPKWLSWCLPWQVLKIIYCINKHVNELMSNDIMTLSKIKDFFWKFSSL